MLSQDLNAYWDQLHDHQSDWAFRAHQRLIETLSSSVQERLQSTTGDKTNPYVVIFGKTQVGKTTLLLDLIGVIPEEMSNVSRIMRGGRELGKSATATAMEYGRSIDERWGLSINSKTKWFEDPNELTQDLGKIREKMENRCLIVDTPCVVYIPHQFFRTTDLASPNVRILDLPGDAPANKEEQEHVKKMAKTYLPFADLILLVGKGDDLGFLRPNAINLPGIEDWQSMPHRFRVITTYSFTNKSVRDLVRSGEISDIKTARLRLLAEIARSDLLNENAQNKELFFPLEFGTSWEDIKDQDPDLYEKTNPIINELREKLLAEIAAASNPMGRLRNTLNTHLSVKYIQKKKTEAVQNEIKELEHKKSEITGDLEILRKTITQTEKEIHKINDVMKNHALHKDIQIIEKATQNPSFGDKTFPPKRAEHNKDSQHLITLINAYWQTLRRMTIKVKPDTKTAQDNENIYKDSYWIKVKNNVNSTDSRVIQEILDKKFSKILDTLQGYIFGTYIFDDNYRRDYEAICRSGEAAKEEIQAYWKNAWIKSLKATNKKYEDSHKKAITENSINAQEYDNLSAISEKISEEISSRKKSIEIISRESEDDLKRCERFVDLLNESYLDEIKNKMDSIYNNNDDCESLLQLFYSAELIDQRNNLMEISKNTTQ